MDLIVACGAIGAVFGVAVGAAASFSREQRAASQHVLAKYEHARNDPGMAEKLMQLHIFRECDPDVYDDICDACNLLSDVHRLGMISTVDKSVKFQYIWRFKAQQYRKRIVTSLTTLSNSVFKWNASQLSRRAAGTDNQKSAAADIKAKSEFARYATELCTTVDNYYNNLMLQ